MAWLGSNWIWILLLVFVAFHLFGRRRHHGYAHHGYDGDGQRGGPIAPPAGEPQQIGATPSGSAPASSVGTGSPQPTEDQHRHRHRGC